MWSNTGIVVIAGALLLALGGFKQADCQTSIQQLLNAAGGNGAGINTPGLTGKPSSFLHAYDRLVMLLRRSRTVAGPQFCVQSPKLLCSAANM